MNKKYKKEIEWSVKSVGYNIEDGGEILDDREWSEEWSEEWEEGESVSFEDGMKKLKEYVCEDKGESEDGEEKWKEMEEMLREIKEEVGDRGDWRLWGVEYDMSLGVEI
jgi:hypothetical protein